MKTFLFIAAMVLTTESFSQDRWNVQLNSEVLLSANEEDTTLNVIPLKDLKKGSLIVTYVPAKAENERKRRLMIFDDKDQEIYTKEAHSISIPASSLKKWKLNTPYVKVYTIPVLGEEGANVRLRRVHLATINFK